MIKKCNKCNIEYDESMFYKHRNICKICNSEYTKKHYNENKEKYKKYNIDNKLLNESVTYKICSKCKIEKPIIEFTGYKYICKQCKKEYDNIYYNDNKEKIKEKTNIYYKKNKSVCKTKNRLSRLKRDPYQLWVYNTLKGHENKGYIININKNYLYMIAKNTKYCPICNVKLKCEYGIKNKFYNDGISLDRINNENVININNIQILCRKCNSIKNDKSENDMILWCKQYIKFVENKNVQSYSR